MMPRCRPSTNPISFHKKTGQFYITRGGRRFYLGSDREAAMEKYFRINLGYTLPDPTVRITPITLKELANRFLTTQQANWKNPQVTLQFYRNTLKRFLNDHRGLFAHEFTVEMYAQWKMYLKRQEYQTKSINHYLSAVRALFRFADETELLERIPRLLVCPYFLVQGL